MLDVFVEAAHDAIEWAGLPNRPKWQWPFVLLRVGWFLCELVIAGAVLVGPFIGAALLFGFLAYLGIRRLLGY
jgi:hypothetical protein